MPASWRRCCKGVGVAWVLQGKGPIQETCRQVWGPNRLANHPTRIYPTLSHNAQDYGMFTPA